jgi:hypothetical protein
MLAKDERTELANGGIKATTSGYPTPQQIQWNSKHFDVLLKIKKEFNRQHHIYEYGHSVPSMRDGILHLRKKLEEIRFAYPEENKLNYLHHFATKEKLDEKYVTFSTKLDWYFEQYFNQKVFKKKLLSTEEKLSLKKINVSPEKGKLKENRKSKRKREQNEKEKVVKMCRFVYS